MSLLPWTIYLSFGGALLSWFGGRRSPLLARWIALASMAGTIAIGACAACQFSPSSGPVSLVNARWLPFADYALSVDGLSLTFVLLTGLAGIAAVLFSWETKKRPGDFFALFLALVGGVYGVFLSADALLLFVFYEIAIVPKYFLVAVWGSTNREYGAMKLVLYSFAGSALVMAGLLWAARETGTSFGMVELVSAARHLPSGIQVPLFALVFTGFAVLAGMFPFHTWAPTGHVAAPTGASMLLAGVVMKLGAYGCLRVALPAFPEGFAMFQPAIAVLAIVGILYAGLVALVQSDFKFVIGYSSVSHMGFVLLGLAAATTQAVSGAVLQMFSHGVVAGLLFAVVGRMVYERTHTRDLRQLRRMALARRMPFVAVVFVLAALASMGMPGFSGFPAELAILAGTWQRSQVWALLAVLGIPVAAAFTLRAVQQAFFGKSAGVGGDGKGAVDSLGGLAGEHPFAPITLPEKLGAVLLLGVSIVIGIRPDLLLDWIAPALESPLLKIAIQGVAQ
ncbi:MAG: NADH-quinone oxidoreductase subunit M [Puniceicoccales bacterium]|jgi:NADH-quinone oxidoreductase subunit M|nr:NADH-quinone oxidoreductase subunit M [Puniceicoccales bacterium]